MRVATLRLTRAAARGMALILALLGSAIPALAQADIVLLPATAPVRAGKWTIANDTTAVNG